MISSSLRVLFQYMPDYGTALVRSVRGRRALGRRHSHRPAQARGGRELALREADAAFRGISYRTASYTI